MSLASGVRFGPYEITAPLGAGGMGEVYRATDTNLKRAVAVKVLPETFAADAGRLARFQREAEVLAALNHPHIAAIYGLERSDGVTALIMELVEGPTLADRIDEGPIPVEDTIAIARQISEGLEAAHSQGIIHRDLKPANIKVRPDGSVKVLDFGLAKAPQPAGLAASGVSSSPTITSPAVMTAAGVLLGTAAYMSPEQVRGTAVDKRSDIWSFGVVLFEMLTGRRAFPGDAIADVLAAVLTREPDWTLLPAGLSPDVSTLLRLCLHKDRAQRLRDIGDAWLALDGAFDRAGSLAAQPAARPRPAWQRALLFAATAIVGGLLTGLVAWSYWPTPDTSATTRFEYVLPEGQQLPSTQRPAIATSADGRSFIYQTTAGVFQRALRELEPRLIPGTEEYLFAPSVSPDGQRIVFFSSSGRAGDTNTSGPTQLRKVEITGGAPVILCAATLPFGISWASDNTILFGQATGVMRVSADGGTPTLIVPARDGEQIYGPQLLPGGRAVLFSATTKQGPNRWDEAQVVTEDLSTHKRTVVVDGGSDPRYLKTGHVVYALGDGLYGIRFDADRLQPTSGRVPLLQGVQRPVGVVAAASHYDVSNDGTLVYIAHSVSSRSLVWVNRDGTDVRTVGTISPGSYQDPRLSPDGRRVLVTQLNDIWVYDIASGRSDRITNDGTSLMGVWNPDGSQIAYSSARKGNLEAWVSSSDGSGVPRQLTTLGGQVHVDSWSADGRTLSLHRHPPQGPNDIYMLAMDRPDASPEVFYAGEASKESAEFSRDRQYVSYLSSETGQREIYIRPYQKPGLRTTVSVGGGREPVWARNGELFYRSPNGEKMFSVSVRTAPKLDVGTPVQLFQGHYYISPTGSPRPQYDVSADGRRFLMLAPTTPAASTADRPRVVVVQHWFDEVMSKIPAK
jgi:eukaryotic-like serine/threonine-protein kinase